MAYDMHLNRQTGDWEFNSIGDLLGTSGDELDRQRIWIRAKVPRGTFTYDETKTLGSTLYQISRAPSTGQLDAARSALLTALEGMSDIDVENVDAVHEEEDQKISLNVFYSKRGPVDQPQVFAFDLATGILPGTSAD